MSPLPACHSPTRPRQVLEGLRARQVIHTRGKVWDSLVERDSMMEIDGWLSELSTRVYPCQTDLGGQTWGV